MVYKAFLQKYLKLLAGILNPVDCGNRLRASNVFSVQDKQIVAVFFKRISLSVKGVDESSNLCLEPFLNTFHLFKMANVWTFPLVCPNCILNRLIFLAISGPDTIHPRSWAEFFVNPTAPASPMITQESRIHANETQGSW